MPDDQAKIKLTHADIAAAATEMGMQFEPEQGRRPGLWCVVQLREAEWECRQTQWEPTGSSKSAVHHILSWESFGQRTTDNG
jgi:hypothetical protein